MTYERQGQVPNAFSLTSVRNGWLLVFLCGNFAVYNFKPAKSIKCRTWRLNTTHRSAKIARFAYLLYLLLVWFTFSENARMSLSASYTLTGFLGMKTPTG